MVCAMPDTKTMHRRTLWIDDAMWQQVQRVAAPNQWSASDFIRAAIRAALRRQQQYETEQHQR